MTWDLNPPSSSAALVEGSVSGRNYDYTNMILRHVSGTWCYSHILSLASNE